MRCMTKFRSDAVPALAALGSLALGILVYALDRSPESVYFLPAAWSLAGVGDRWFGSLGGQLPEFAHVYAFSLLTVAILASPHRLVKVNIRSRLSLPSCKDTRLASKDCHVPPLIHYHVTNNAGQRRPFDSSR